MSEAMLIRFLVAGYLPKAAPDDRFYESIDVIRKLYDRLDIVKEHYDDPDVRKFVKDEVENWKRFRIALEKVYLLPERASTKWQ